MPITSEMSRPLNYRDRTMHQLPNDNGLLQTRLDEINNFCQIQQMKINESKTKTAVFNTARSRDFYPRMKNANDSMFEK